ncbi:large ribosomal subunit protein uL3m isoform X2 [Parasteatoda tepidariorum]|uniref:large ribosomal subunit protein uL3m isoform X2 n=1 Tax=Parasteatoda tepidariorum TaxID=114398 RepID=UPI0039BCDDBA
MFIYLQILNQGHYIYFLNYRDIQLLRYVLFFLKNFLDISEKLKMIYITRSLTLYSNSRCILAYAENVLYKSSIRTGVIARKIGIYPLWTKSGQRIMTTLLQVLDNHVIRYNPPEIFSQSKYYDDCKDPSKVYGSLVVGAESADPQLFTAAYNGLFAEAGVMPKRKLTRFRITPDAKLEPGTPLFANHFEVGDYVNVRGITRYHGFQGVMKRWGFKGGPATHGCTKSHRRPGCIGGGRKRGVWKGKKLPGLMGGYARLQRGLKIWRINTKYNVLYVHGPAVPGIINNYCIIYDCYIEKKCHTEDDPPHFPTFFPEDMTEPVTENLYDEQLHNFSDPSVTFEDEEASKS